MQENFIKRYFRVSFTEIDVFIHATQVKWSDFLCRHHMKLLLLLISLISCKDSLLYLVDPDEDHHHYNIQQRWKKKFINIRVFDHIIFICKRRYKCDQLTYVKHRRCRNENTRNTGKRHLIVLNIETTSYTFSVEYEKQCSKNRKAGALDIIEITTKSASTIGVLKMKNRKRTWDTG
jgi:hypothetical protein